MYRFPQFTFPSSLSRWLGAAILGSLVGNSHAASADSPMLAPGERETLRRYARDTWKSFEAMVLPGGLPADGLRWRRNDGVDPDARVRGDRRDDGDGERAAPQEDGADGGRHSTGSGLTRCLL